MIEGDVLRFAVLDEAGFNGIAAGQFVVEGVSWPEQGRLNRGLQEGIGVVWRERPGRLPSVRPVMIVVSEMDQRRLFGRFAQVRSDLSPLSAWCHIVTPEQFERIHSSCVESDLDGFEACWTGLAIAEAAILAGRPVSSLKVVACLATQSYAIGRAFALWGPRSITSILEVFDNAQKGLRHGESTLQGIRETLTPIWNIMSALLGGKVSINGDERHIVTAIRAIQRAKSTGLASEIAIFDEFRDFPAAEFLRRLDTMSPEERLRQFDKIVDGMADEPTTSGKFTKLAFLAGFLATIAAGGASSLRLAEGVSNRYPQITAWSYVIGGIGESITWTSAFDGLGRMVSREFGRAFYASEAPACDFSVSEAAVLIDRQLSDPLVHLRVKQLRTVAVALYPGVNIVVPLHDQFVEQQRTQNNPPASAQVRSESVLDDLAATLFPRMLPYLEEYLGISDNRKITSKAGRKNTQRKLL